METEKEKYQLQTVKYANDEEKQYALVAQSYAIDIEEVKTEIVSTENNKFEDLDKAISIIDSRLSLLENNSDELDYAIAAASGLLCGLLDAFLLGDLDLTKLRGESDDKVKEFVMKFARKKEWDGKGDISSAVKHLEEKYTLASDPNMKYYGGSLKHHYNEFAHHPSIIGLIFSLLTQFTQKTYGIDNNGKFLVKKIGAKYKKLIGKNVPEKFILGTFTWFGHLVSDMAGSAKTAAITGGTGIPGPIMSLAKEISALPFIKANPKFLDDIISGKSVLNIKMDLRGEIALFKFLEKQSIPVIANDAIVRTFFLIRRLINEIKNNENIHTIKDLNLIEKTKYIPFNNKTVQTMLTISSSVFTTVDLTDALIRNGTHFYLKINYPGVAKLAIDISIDIKMSNEKRNLVKLREKFLELKNNKYYGMKYNESDFVSNLASVGLSLNVDELYILYNIRIKLLEKYHWIKKNKYSIKNKVIKKDDQTILDEMKIEKDIIDNIKNKLEQEFINTTGIEKFECLTIEEINKKIVDMDINKNNKALILLESMTTYLFEIKDEKTNVVLSFDTKKTDEFIETSFGENLLGIQYVRKFRDMINSLIPKLKDKNLKKYGYGAGGAILVGTACTIFAPGIAVALVGGNFALSGAALTSASLATIGGGSLAAGGLGMAGGTAIIGASGSIIGASSSALVSNKYDYNESFVQYIEMLTFIKEIYLNEYKDRSHIKAIYNSIIEEKIPELEKYKKGKKGEIENKKLIMKKIYNNMGKIEKIKNKIPIIKKNNVSDNKEEIEKIKLELKELNKEYDNASKTGRLNTRVANLLKKYFNDDLTNEYVDRRL